MDWFKMVNRFYPKYWTKGMVGDAVLAEKISEEEYFKITGDIYSTEHEPEEIAKDVLQETEDPQSNEAPTE